MESLIKWPGGKTQEFNYIKDLIPRHKRYIEPFFGGGAVYFNLEKSNAVINDIVEELTDFYKFVKGDYNTKKFRDELVAYVDNWEKVPKYISFFDKSFINLYYKFKDDKINLLNLRKSVEKIIKDKEEKFNGMFKRNFCIDENNLAAQITKNLISKLIRIKKIETVRGNISLDDLHKNIETAFRSGFYMHFRDVMNNSEKYKISLAKKIANYYFIREFCYASMFRFNSKDEFNIPYGGIAYNTKNFRKKVDNLFNKETKDFFSNTEIKNQDFEDFFRDIKINSDDFIFLDPPYDSEFSDYQKNVFNRKDQERLAKCLYKIKAKFILIIKKTPFIYDLYKDRPNINIKKFNKTYLYNMKGRNDRDVEHLLIYNF